MVAIQPTINTKIAQTIENNHFKFLTGVFLTATGITKICLSVKFRNGRIHEYIMLVKGLPEIRNVWYPGAIGIISTVGAELIRRGHRRFFASQAPKHKEA